MGTNIKFLSPYLIDGFTTNGLGVTPDPPATGLYNIFLGSDKNLYLQDDANNVTQLNGGGGSVPTATSGAGGGIQGKLTTDSNYGLVITAGVLTFSLSSTGGLEFQTGSLKIKLDGSTIASGSSGIKIADDSITDTQISSSAGITRSKLSGGTNNAIVINSSSGVMNDSSSLTFAVGASDNTLAIKANVSQTANIVEVQNDSGTALSYFNSGGYLILPGDPTTANMAATRGFVLSNTSVASGPGYDYLYDDYDGGTGGRLGWVAIAGTTGSYNENAIEAGVNSTDNGSGVWRIFTGTNTAGRGGIYTNDSAYLMGYQTFDQVWRINIPTLYSVAQQYKIFIGFGDDIVGGEHTNGAYFLYDGGVSANWQICTAASGTRTRTTSSQAVTTNWCWLRVVISTTDVKFYYGTTFGSWTLLGTINTNLPTAATQQFGNTAKIVKSAGTTDRFAYLDCFSLSKTWVTSR